MISEGCFYHIIRVKVFEFNAPHLETLAVVKDCPEVFPDDLLGISPKREIDFNIDLMPYTKPISILPYQMAPAEFRKLKA